MATDSRNWQLFGYDLHSVLGLWRAGWRELFWGQGSRLRALLDEPVRVHYPDSALEPSGETASAQVLPDDLVLTRWLSLPQAVEGELLSVLALEVRANSPFPADDTCFGWRIGSRANNQLRVCLAIVSRSAVLGYLRGHLAEQAVERTEVWAEVDGQLLVVEGFGETRRYDRYRRRLRRLGLYSAYCLLVLLLILSVPMGIRYAQWQSYETLYQDTRREAADAVRLRNQLTASEQRLAAIKEEIAAAGKPYRELQRLTGLLGDDIWLSQFELRGDRLRIQGEADNAAALMQELSTRGWYSDVRATAAIRRQRSGKESFALELTPSAQWVMPEPVDIPEVVAEPEIEPLLAEPLFPAPDDNSPPPAENAEETL